MSVPDLPEYLPDVTDEAPGDAARMLRDVARLLRDLVRDPRVPWQAKAMAAAASIYVAPGVRRLLPRPPLAVVVDPLVLMVALRHLVAAAGYEVVRETWKGGEAGFVWLLVLSGIDA
jgi:hypothetical protein